MPKKIEYVLSDSQLEKLKNIFDNSKAKLPSNINTFDQFLDWSIDVAIESHIQFSTVNNKMMDMLDSTFGNNDFNLNNIDEFINNVFASSSGELKQNKKKVKDKDDDPNKTSNNKIKN